MKKIYGIIIFMLACFLLPVGAQASNYGIENFDMHITVLENGDLYVREAFLMNGSFNGMDRDIYFKNSAAGHFNGDLDSFKGSDIYNGTGIELIQIRAIPYTNSITWKEMETAGTQFNKASYGNSGDFGIYTENRNSDGVSYRIFNPSSKKRFFYIEYILKDMAISHSDVAEIGWNIFNSSFRESIHHFKADIYLPQGNSKLLAWAHGPLTGNIELDGNNHIILTVDNLPAYTAMDTRFVFDKSVLTSVKKETSVTALDSIVSIETELADQANAEREAARKMLEEEEKRQRNMRYLFTGIGIVWTIGLILLVHHVYKKYDKEYESTFKTKYYRDFPADYNPSTVGYLFHQTIRNQDLSACLLNLIDKKVVTFEKLEKKDYKLSYHENLEVMSEADQKLVKLIFREPEITLNNLKKKAKSGYSSFIRDFTAWKNAAMDEAMKEDFFEKKGAIKAKTSLYSLIGIFLGAFSFTYSILLGMVLFLCGMISLFYFLLFTKRTKKGNEHYLKWKALKNFMEDFGSIDKKDLPEIVLWEKYLVYAVSLGCADKLAKTMELRINEFTDYDMVNMVYDVHMVRDMMVFNHIVSTSVNSAVNSAYSAQSIANSSNSSGGGFGGGFSGGGGSFGGGSGGGRF